MNLSLPRRPMNLSLPRRPMNLSLPRRLMTSPRRQKNLKRRKSLRRGKTTARTDTLKRKALAPTAKIKKVILKSKRVAMKKLKRSKSPRKK